MIHRFILIVLDSVGIGELPDAHHYGDGGSNTLGNIAKHIQGLHLPNFERLGLGNIAPILGVAKTDKPLAAWGKMNQLSAGKDTTIGHWELAGLWIKEPLPTYPKGFPRRLVDQFSHRIGREILGNCVASGTVIIDQLGSKHMETGNPIVYTSADSVFQIAAHEQVVPLHLLYQWCLTARELLDGEHRVARVIARPFIGEPGCFSRTSNRRDFSLEPLGITVLDYLTDHQIPVHAIGKIKDIFAGRGVTSHISTKNNMQTINATLSLLQKHSGPGLIFANCVDFDMLWGHRNDVKGYACGLEELDTRIPELLMQLKPDDVLCIVADHGCDPTTKGTDHSREYVPLLVYGDRVTPCSLGIRETFSDVAQSIATYFHLETIFFGTSFLAKQTKEV